LFYGWYGYVLHKVGKHEKEKEIFEIGLRLFPRSSLIIRDQAVCALSRGDTTEANECLYKVKSVHKNEYGFSELDTEMKLGYIYEEANIIDKAEEHYRNAFELAPQDINPIYGLVQK